MYDLPKVIPDLEVLLALEPEELAGKLLFLLNERVRREGKWLPNLHNISDEPFADRSDGVAPYRYAHRDDVHLVLAEAWSWLEAQGLLVSATGSNGTSGFRVLSRRAQKFSNETEFANYKIARHLSRDALHPRIAQAVWQAFMRGEFDVAVFQATKAVEVYVRETTGFDDEVGIKLMRKAFDKTTGPLIDPSAEEGEREAMAHLFAGAIGVYKNPQSHRDVNVDDPTEAMEIIMLANRLLKIVDARSKRQNVSSCITP